LKNSSFDMESSKISIQQTWAEAAV
jgi:hypothetical protein